MPYHHLSEHERYQIDHMILFGLSRREIGRRLHRSVGTISRELQRNGHSDGGGYWNYRAQALATARRHQRRGPRRMREGSPLSDYVRRGLFQRWSPQQIARRLRLDHPRDAAMRISHEAIYQWVYADPAFWHEQLRRRHRRRKPHRPAGAAKAGQIVGRIGIEQRPAVVEKRTRLGDWESDTLLGAPGSGGVATHVERRTRLLLAARLDDRGATHFARRSLAAFRAAGLGAGTLPGAGAGVRCCRTLTADNGKEFADFKRLEKGLGLRVYFARPYAAWERGTCENTNGLLRDYFPKGTDFRTITNRQVAYAVWSLNNRPRKCLGYRTPVEVFSRLAGVALQI